MGLWGGCVCAREPGCPPAPPGVFSSDPTITTEQDPQGPREGPDNNSRAGTRHGPAAADPTITTWYDAPPRRPPFTNTPLRPPTPRPYHKHPHNLPPQPPPDPKPSTPPDSNPQRPPPITPAGLAAPPSPPQLAAKHYGGWCRSWTPPGSPPSGLLQNKGSSSSSSSSNVQLRCSPLLGGLVSGGSNLQPPLFFLTPPPPPHPRELRVEPPQPPQFARRGRTPFFLVILFIAKIGGGCLWGGV